MIHDRNNKYLSSLYIAQSAFLWIGTFIINFLSERYAVLLLAF